MDAVIDKKEQIVDNNRLRIHRAKSWLRSANDHTDTEDIAFISLWIALNACYAVEGASTTLSERESFKRFINKLVYHDQNKTIYNCLWFNFSYFVKGLIDSQYVFEPFWRAQREGGDDWQSPFDSAKRYAYNALSNGDVNELLMIVLDRLYVLRNQLVHGGATYKSRVNRDQVKNGQRFLMALMPLMVTLIEGDMASDWGKVSYPVVNG